MNLAVAKDVLALAATAALFAGATVLYGRRRGIDFLLLLVGAGCFVVVALTHVFETFGLFPTLGWGQPRTVGHYIDLAAAIVGLTLVLASVLIRYVRRATRRDNRDSP